MKSGKFVSLIFVLFFAGLCFAFGSDLPDVNEQLRFLKSAALIKALEDINNAEAFLRDVIHMPVVAPKKAQKQGYYNEMMFGPDVDEKKKHFNSRKEKHDEIIRFRELIDKHKKRLVCIEANDVNEIVLPFWPPLVVGQMGHLKTYGLSDIIGGDYQTVVHTGRRFIQPQMKILGIVDGNNCIVNFTFGYKERHPGPSDPVEKIIYIRGVSTANLADGSLLSPPPFMRCTGTTDYFHPIGEKNTLFVLEPFTPPASF